MGTSLHTFPGYASQACGLWNKMMQNALSLLYHLELQTKSPHTYNGCSGWISSPSFPAPFDGDIYLSYSIEVAEQHVSSELE